MKRLLLMIIALALCLLLAACGNKTGGGEDEPTPHKHVGGSATCIKGAICTECGEEYGEPSGEHEWEDLLRYDGEGHFNVCEVCQGVFNRQSHTADIPDGCGIEYACACGYVLGVTPECDFGGDYLTDETHHRLACLNGCGRTSDPEEHRGGEATVTKRAECEVCGIEYGERASIEWRAEAIMPTDGGLAVLANDEIKSFVEGFDYTSTLTDGYALGWNYYMPDELTVKWSVGEAALYYKLYISRAADMSAPEILLTNGCEVSLDFLYAGTEYFWYVDAIYDGYTVRSRVFSFTTAAYPRTVNIEGVSNSRDIGGYLTEEGKRIKQGLVYRAARLDSMTELGRYTLLYILDIKTDLDLRGEDGTRPLGDAVNYVNTACPWYSTGENGIWANDATRVEFARTIKVFADPENYPIIFHCSLGRDRTGCVAMVLEGLLGLDINTIMMDYELSAFSSQGTLDSTSYASLRSQLLATYNYILDNYEGESFSECCESFLLDIGVTAEEIETIRSIMLEEVE